MGGKPQASVQITNQHSKGVKSSVGIAAAAITAVKNARISLNRFKNIPGNKYLPGDPDSAILQNRLTSWSGGRRWYDIFCLDYTQTNITLPGGGVKKTLRL